MTAEKMYDFLRERGVFPDDEIFLAAPQHVRDALTELAELTEDAGVAGAHDHLDEIDEAVARIRAQLL